MPLTGRNKTVGTVMGMTIIFLTIELLDELVGGVLVGAWPLISQDLQLSYGQVGLAMTLPNIIANIIEPIIGIWGDIGHRRFFIIGGGIGFAIALFLLSMSKDFVTLLAGFILFAPSSGSFVNLCQATLMDLDPTRHEQNMARWVLAGSLGNVLGPLILVGAIALHQSWRGAFFLLALLTDLLLVRLWNAPITLATIPHEEQPNSFKDGLFNAITALRRPSILRWLTLLQFSDLMLDVLAGFVALYFVNVVGTSTAQASLAIAVWLGIGLLGDILLIPLLERVRGLSYLRVSAGLVLGLYPAFLLVPHPVIKFAILGCLGFLNAGWYSILQGQLYTAMPKQSGTVMTLNNLFGWIGSLAPLGLGLMAQYAGLESAMWLLIASPIALLIGLFW
ncbi:MFS transporter [Vacuolonema iberomarrocanum]|uniref:MFS transporter n=1 Tax=Vacuolonema iberomarrocanum TaxID=3454632 RepID=UPI001A05809F|nr:MFS transporter [filamentous cyanobacterium LEGE 07170]